MTRDATESWPKFEGVVSKLFRLPFVESNIYSGTTTWRDCVDALGMLTRPRTLVEGESLSAYEAACGRLIGCPNVFSFATGRMALYAILEALGIGPGDEVILPAFTCVVVPNAILYRGAIPVYVDIDRRTYNIDVGGIEARITPRTRAILAQHTFGLPCDLAAIREIALRRRLDVIEDWAHAVGALCDAGVVGRLRRIAYFSSDHTKVFSTSTGGAAATDDDGLADRLRQIHSSSPDIGLRRTLRVLFTLIVEHVLTHPTLYRAGKYVHAVCNRLHLFQYFPDEMQILKPKRYPYPARLSNLQARIGLNQVRDLKGNLRHRRHIAKQYDAVLKVHTEHLAREASHTFLRYSFLVSDRDEFERTLKGVVDLGIWFRSVVGGRNRAFHEVGYEEGSCPVAEHVAAHVVNLPTHFRVRRVDDILDVLSRLDWEPDSGHFTLRVQL